MTDRIALDTETDLIAPYRQAPPLACVSLARSGASALLPWNEPDLPRTLERILAGPMVGCWVSYDTAVIMQQFPELTPHIFEAYREGRITDVATRAKLADIAAGHREYQPAEDGGRRKSLYGIDGLSQRYLGRPTPKGSERLGFGELRSVPFDAWPEGHRRYALSDAIATRDIDRAQGVDHPDEFRQARADFWLRLCSNWGIVTDPVAVDALRRRTVADLEATQKVLEEYGLVRANGSRNMKAVSRRVEQAYPGGPPQTKGGKASTAKDVCVDSGDPVLERYAHFSHLRKMLSTDLPILENPIVHTRYEVLRETGRTASGSGEDDEGAGNMQNLPKKGGIRECFVPRPGCAFVVSDFAGLELSTWAQCCYSLLGHSRLRDMLLTGVDPHLSIAAILLGRSYDDCKGIRKNAGHPLWDQVNDARQLAKIVNFGFQGGMGPKRFVEHAKKKSAEMGKPITVSLDQAYRLKDVWTSLDPETVRKYFAHVESLMVGGRGTITQLFSGRVRGDCGYSDAANGYFQGLGADLAKEAGWLLTERIFLDRVPARIVLFGHDEFVTECPLERIDETAELQERCMAQAVAKWLPDVPCGVETVATMRYSKDAKRIVKEGRLVPWAA